MSIEPIFYTVYKITNKINGKIYVGCHQTKNLDDGYLGSGNLIKRAVQKYGEQNFEKEYIHIFENETDMFEAESMLVNEEFVKQQNTYNITEGGHGGWSHQNKNSEVQRRKQLKSQKSLKNRLKNDPQFLKKYQKHGSKIMSQAHKNGKIRYDTFTGKKHTNIAKRKIGEANSKHQKGKGNSQYGTMWICNLELKENKKISKEEEIPHGWVRGRKIFK